MRKLFFLIVIFTIACVSLFSTQNAQAATVIWDGGGDGTNWSNPLNWSDDLLPLGTNNIVIDGNSLDASNVFLDIDFSLSTGSIVIESGDKLTIDGGITLSNSGNINNTGILVNLGTLKNSVGGKFNNDGEFSNDSSLTNNGDIVNNGIFNNFGILINNGTLINNALLHNENMESGGFIFNKGVIDNFGRIENLFVINNNDGGIINNSDTIENLDVIKNNRGTINNSGTIDNNGEGDPEPIFENNGGTINNIFGATLGASFGAQIRNNMGMMANSGHVGYGDSAFLVNNATLTNEFGGTIFVGTSLTNTVFGKINNTGSIVFLDASLNNSGKIQNSGTLNNNPLSVIVNNPGAVIDNMGTINNPTPSEIKNNGVINNTCVGVINSTGTISGNPVIDVCNHYPIIHMQDTTASFGLSVHSARPIQAELATPTSQLVGDKIDTIILKLKKFGTPTGTAIIGIFSSDLSVKKIFGTIDASTVSAIYTDYTFSLPTTEQPYQIQSGDRIGIKFTGGNNQNNLGVMTDNNPADPFDGTNSYHVYYTTKWFIFINNDIHMTLKEQDASSPISYPIKHMEDTAASFGLSTFSGRQINAEFVSDTSQLVGDQIDTITLKLRKFGTPTGTAQIGIFSSDLSVKKLFGTKDVSTLTNIYTDYAFALPLDQSYVVQSGDRIGVKFLEGDVSNNLSVMTDQNNADPFDGTNSYLTSYTTLWNNVPQTKDLTMTLTQNHS